MRRIDTTTKIKALSVRQPWANWIARGEKTIETRTWKTKYRGPLLICAAKKPAWGTSKDICFGPLGVAVAVATLIDCRQMDPDDRVEANCDWNPDLFSWELDHIRSIDEPFDVRGKPGLFEVDIEGVEITHHGGFSHPFDPTKPVEGTQPHEERERLSFIAICPACGGPIAMWVETEDWNQGAGGRWWHESYGDAFGGCVNGCGCLFEDACDGNAFWLPPQTPTPSIELEGETAELPKESECDD